MKIYKILFVVLLGLFAGRNSYAQGSAFVREEVPFSDKNDLVKSVQIYPNPATDFLSLKLENGQARKIRITVYTIIGNTVEVESEILDDFEVRLKVRDLPSGYYLLALHNPETNNKNTLKFLKR